MYIRRNWTQEETAYLESNYQTMRAKDIAETLNRPLRQIEAKVNRMGLSKTGKTGEKYIHWNEKTKTYAVSFQGKKHNFVLLSQAIVRRDKILNTINKI